MRALNSAGSRKAKPHPSSSGVVRPIDRPVRHLAAALFVLCIPALSNAQVSSPFEEQSKLMKAPRAYASIGIDLFGDNVNLSNGTVQFRQTDVSLKGNNELAVAVTRKFSAGTQATPDRAFGRWNLDIPHIHGIFATKEGWTTPGRIGGRCTNFGSPDTAMGTSPRNPEGQVSQTYISSLSHDAGAPPPNRTHVCL